MRQKSSTGSTKSVLDDRRITGDCVPVSALPKAITALARKLACLFYRLIKHGHPYVDKGTEYYEARYREQQIRSLAKRAQKLGLELVIPKTA